MPAASGVVRVRVVGRGYVDGDVMRVFLARAFPRQGKARERQDSRDTEAHAAAAA